MQPVDKPDEKPNRIPPQPIAHRPGAGLGGGLVGAAIGGLLGRQVGGAFGVVVGTVAGAMVGKGTAQRVNYAVEGVVDAAKSIAEGVNQSANTVSSAVEDVKPSIVGVVDAVKDVVEDVKPSIVGVVDAVKGTVEDVNPSIVGAATSVFEGVNNSIKGVTDILKDSAEEVKPSVVASVDALKNTVNEVEPSFIGVEDVSHATVKPVQLSDHHNGKVYKQRLVRVYKRRSSQKHPLSNNASEQVDLQPNNSPQTNLNKLEYKSFHERQENTENLQTKSSKFWNKKIPKTTGLILGAATITYMGITLGFNPKHTLNLESNYTLSPIPEAIAISPKPETIAEGWIFIGNIKKSEDSSLIGKSIIKGSQFTDSPVVPSLGSVITVGSGVNLRENRPQAPNFNHQEQKVLAILKPQEKVKVLIVESVIPDNTTRPMGKVWAKVYRCGDACN